MDSSIDLTINRDFRKPSSYNEDDDIPRSIFRNRHHDDQFIFGDYFLDNNATTALNVYPDGTQSNWMIVSGNTTSNSINSISADKCAYCGADITRLPWQCEVYGSVCRKCFKLLEANRSPGHRIPWK